MTGAAALPVPVPPVPPPVPGFVAGGIPLVEVPPPQLETSIPIARAMTYKTFFFRLHTSFPFRDLFDSETKEEVQRPLS